jgi:hypothetical protein
VKIFDRKRKKEKGERNKVSVGYSMGVKFFREFQVKVQVREQVKT